MASHIPSLTAGTYTDPGQPGLQLRVRPKAKGVTRSWLLRIKFQREETRILLGHFPDLTLDAARGKARRLRELASQGIDPRRAEARRRLPREATNSTSSEVSRFSVKALANDFMARHVTPQRKRPEYVQRILDHDVLPVWGERDARTVQPFEVIELLDGIVDRGKKVMANRVAAVISQMFKFGIHRQIVTTTPVQLLFRPGGKEKPRERALSNDELKAFMKCKDEILSNPLTGHERNTRTGHALMVLLLTLQRRNELALAEWKHFDFGAKTWTIPDELAKAGKGHVVPLTDWAVEELLAMKKLAGRSKYVFPTDDGESPAEGKLITRSVARCQEAFKKKKIAHWTPHDLRRTGRTGLARLKVQPHIAERVLNHAQEKIPGTYDVHDYLDEKREALEKWTEHLRKLRDEQKN